MPSEICKKLGPGKQRNLCFATDGFEDFSMLNTKKKNNKNIDDVLGVVPNRGFDLNW